MKTMKCIWLTLALMCWGTIDGLSVWFWCSFVAMIVVGLVLAWEMDRKEMKGYDQK